MKFYDSFTKIIATFFYVGYFPLIPGTAASLAGLALLVFAAKNANLYFWLLCIFLFLGFLTSGAAERILQKKDARQIVIDEIAGIWITFLFIPLDLKLAIIGFVVFRLMDTLKPYPASGIQAKKGSLGVMGDDIVAGIYANIILQAVFRLAAFKTS